MTDVEKKTSDHPMETFADFEAKAQDIIKIAEQYGVEKNFLFVTTMKRYVVQLRVLKDLEDAIAENGSLVTKEYVKGRQNLYTNPAIREYNNATNSANKTVSTLMTIIKTNSTNYTEEGEEDPLIRLIRGDNE